MSSCKLNEIKNLDDYLLELRKYKDQCLICAAVKDTLHGIDEESVRALREFGMENIVTGWNGYVFLMKNGKVIIDKSSKTNIPLVEPIRIENSKCQLISKPWRSGNKGKIIIDEIDLSVNKRGLNMAIIDSRTRKLIDSVCFDFFEKKPLCSHKNGYIIPSAKVINKTDDAYDINRNLEKIINEYRISEFYPRYASVHESKKIIRDISNRWKDTESIACIVIGSSDDKMYLDEECFLESIDLDKGNQIDFFRCTKSKSKTSFGARYSWDAYDFNILNTVVWDGYSHVYIISNQGENFVGMWLRKHGIKYESLCDILCAHGEQYIPSNEEFYEFIPDRRESRFFKKNSETSSAQWEYYEQSTRYRMYQASELKLVCAKKCFFLSLILKDFLHAEEWVERITKVDAPESRYYEAWVCVQKLLKEIRSRLIARQQRDILAVWVDHTLYEDLEMMPFVSSLKERSIWFENIFTLTGYTRETLRGLFTGRKLIEDQTGMIGNINLSNSPILEKLEENGYKINILLKGFRVMFPRKYQSMIATHSFIQTSELLWDSISYLLGSSQPGFVLLPIEETHPPYISVGVSDENIFSKDSRARIAYQETDRQIEFYTNMLGENSTSVIFSDHGGYSRGKLGTFWPRQQVFLSIYGKRYHARKVKGLCSSIDFNKLMSQIIHGDEVQEEELFREFVEIEGVPIVSSRAQIEGNGILPQAAPSFWPPFRGYKGIVTNDYVYIYFAGGREWLSRRDKLQPRLSWYARSDDICDVKLLPEMRKKAGIDYGNEPLDYGPISPFYAITTKAYKENYPYNEVKLHLINSLVARLPNTLTALYLGDHASREAYLSLSLANRKKLVCIIHKTPDCPCSELGLPVIPLEKLTEYGVRQVLVVARSMPKELGDFLKRQGQGIHAFGIYGWFEVNGYHTRHNFYDFAIQSMDAPLPSPTSIPDFLHFASGDSFCEIAVVVVVQDEKTLLDRLHGILKQAPLGIRIYCLDLAGKAADRVKEYQNIDTSIEVVPVDGYPSLSMKMNEMISSVKSKYILFLAVDEHLHAGGLAYLHELIEKTEADVAAAAAVVIASKEGKPALTDFSSGAFQLKKEAQLLAATFNERYAECQETTIPRFTGNKLYRVDYLRQYNIRFPAIQSGWKDIFCLQTIFQSPKYVKAVSPVCISDGSVSSKSAEVGSAKELVGTMFAYQQAVETLLAQMKSFGNNTALCDKFRERAMYIFDWQHFSGLVLDEEKREIISQTVQEEIQNNPTIGVWWIKYLFMHSSFLKYSVSIQ